MKESGIEICSNCKRELPYSEQAYVFQGKVLCEECDKKLRSELAAKNGSSDATDSELFKCHVCGDKFSHEQVLYTINDDVICKGCFKERRNLRTSGAGKKVLLIILAGFGLYVLGIGLSIVAVWCFLSGRGSLAGTAMAGGVLAIAVPCFKFGTECLREAWWAGKTKR